SLEIQRMPKVFGLRFAQLQQNPYLSVATIATHDMPPLRLWWRENQEQTQAFWHDVLGRAGEAPAEAEAEVCEQVVAMHLESPSMLCLLALQDWLAIDATLRNPYPENEQINVPSNPNQYWQYRMHLTLEDLVQATSFNEKLRALVARSGR
ncbi:4-alpha-glucanotransferase, partial [gut metagenome]